MLLLFEPRVICLVFLPAQAGVEEQKKYSEIILGLLSKEVGEEADPAASG